MFFKKSGDAISEWDSNRKIGFSLWISQMHNNVLEPERDWLAFLCRFFFFLLSTQPESDGPGLAMKKWVKIWEEIITLWLALWYSSLISVGLFWCYQHSLSPLVLWRAKVYRNASEHSTGRQWWKRAIHCSIEGLLPLPLRWQRTTLTLAV